MPCCGASSNPNKHISSLSENSEQLNKSVLGRSPETKIACFYPLTSVKRSLHSSVNTLTCPVYLRLFEKPCQTACSEKHGVAIEAHSCVAMRSLIYIPTPQRGHIFQNPDGLSHCHCQKHCSSGQTPQKHYKVRVESENVVRACLIMQWDLIRLCCNGLCR